VVAIILIMKMDLMAGSGNDEFYTPPYAIYPILEYLRPQSTIWCPFDTEDSFFVKIFKRKGFNVVATHIDNGENFF
jgi:sugar-phospahte nucleotidyltransferase